MCWSAALTRLAGAIPDGHVLEIGSGPGWDADTLEAAGLTVRRTDVTQAFIDLQRARGSQVDRLDVIHDALRRPVHGVVALHVLQHVEPDALPGVLSKVAGALRRAAASWCPSLEAKAPAGRTRSRHVVLPALWTEAEFVAALERAGLTPEWADRAVEDEERGWLCILARPSQPAPGSA